MTTSDNSDVRQQSNDVAHMADEWTLSDTLMDGTSAMRAAGRKYLPRFPKEPADAYAVRLSQAVLHPAFRRTVLALALKPHSRAMTYTVSPDIEAYMTDVDTMGTPLPAFSVDLMTDCLAKGLVGVLADCPRYDPNIRTMADQEAAGWRPYLVRYRAHQILGWKTDGHKLTQLRLLEWVDVPKSPFKDDRVEQVRVLEPGKWSVWRQNSKNEWYEFENDTTSLDFIPFVFFYGNRKGFGIGQSPLRDLAHQNVEHWQSSSDQQTLLHIARVPILFAKKFGDTEVTAGAGCVAASEDEKASLEYVEHSGAAIGAGRQAILDLEERMRSSGAELLSEKTAYTTATQVATEAEAAKSILLQIVEQFEESMEKALTYMSVYTHKEQIAEVHLYKDFSVGNSEDPATLAGAVSVGTLSNESHFEELQRRDVISADRTWEDEAARLENQSPQKTAA